MLNNWKCNHFLVAEYAPGGTLKERLLDDSVNLCWMQRISYASNIAEGMVSGKLFLT